MHVYIYIYVCVFVCMYVCVYKCMYVRVFIEVCTIYILLIMNSKLLHFTRFQKIDSLDHYNYHYYAIN